MKILDDLVSKLNFQASVRDIRQGPFHTGVVTRNCGLASTLLKDAFWQDGHPFVQEPGFLLNKSTQELVRLAYSESVLEAAIGMATINSLIDVDEDRCVALNAHNLIAEKGEGKKVAIVGHFPFIPKLREVVKKLWVIEKNPSEGDFTELEAEGIIPQADVVGITGTAFTNHTIEHLLELCNNKAYVVILGDTTPLSPILFDCGVNALSGTKVIDADLALRCVSQGATFRQIKGVRLLTMKKDRS
jgi:hypothetical protein